MKTKSILGLVALLALVAMPNIMMAIPSPCAATGTLADLISAGTCTIDGLAFTFDAGSFSDTSTGAGLGPTSASQVSYTVDDGLVPNPQNVPIYGFEFDPNVGVLGVGSDDLLIHYTVSAPADVLTSLHVDIAATVVGSNAIGSVVEDDIPCLGLAETNCGTDLTPDLQVDKTTSGETLYDDIPFASGGPYASFAVTKDINATSTNANGYVNISDVRDAFDKAVPEPASVSFVALGLLGLAGALRRRKQA